ncbi:MAG: substrate-binding domain-containing protein [Phycisphaerales bacterium]
MKYLSIVGLFAFMAIALCACDRSPSGGAAKAPETAAKKPLRVAVVPKGTSHDYWKSVHAGALKAQRELGGIEITFRGPEREDDRDQQVSLIQNLIASKYDAIVLAPLDRDALAGPVREAKAAGIPVVVIDSGLAGEAGKDFVSFVATDNRKGGEMGGKHLAEAMGGKGKVLLLRYSEGSASTTEREEGFVEAVSRYEGITLLDPKRYAGVTRATAQEAAESLLASNGDITGVFCPNESSTFGMLLALKSKGLAGKVRFVGFDASDAAVEALKQGQIDALVLQNPIRMGQLGVTTVVEHLRGKAQPPAIDTGAALVTPQNMNNPEMKDLLAPDLAALLGGK